MLFPDLVTQIQNTACYQTNTIQLRNNPQQILIFCTSGGSTLTPYREVCGGLFSVNVKKKKKLEDNLISRVSLKEFPVTSVHNN